MKLPGFTIHAPRSARREQGMAVIVVMALIVLVLIYLMGNARTFYALGRELKLLDRQQTRRLQLSLATTNAPAPAIVNTNAAPKIVPPQSPSQAN